MSNVRPSPLSTLAQAGLLSSPARRAPRLGRRLLRIVLILSLVGLVSATGIALTLRQLGIDPVLAWHALEQTTHSQRIRYVMRRLEGHPNLERLVHPPLLAWRTRLERPVPESLQPGKGWQTNGPLPPLRYDAQGRPLAPDSRERAISPLPPRERLEVADMAQLRRALQLARPGTVIEVLPGRYRWSDTLSSQAAGLPEHPIVLRAARPGTVRFDVDTVQALVLRHRHWVVENLVMRGVCGEPRICEHALHVVADGFGLVIRNNRFEDFNAHLKINGESGLWPDHGLVLGNTLTNTAVRHTVNESITPIDLVGASGWQVVDNRIENFIRPHLSKPAYGVFLKGGGGGSRIVGNWVICALSDVSQPGLRVGISLGGGGTGEAYMRPGSDGVEQRGSTVAGNVVAHCNEVGVDVNRSIDSRVLHNVLINTSGIGLRNGANAMITGNRLDGRIVTRDTSRADAWDNELGDTRSVFRHADALDLREPLGRSVP
jgi:hypothetical protein